MGAGMLGGILGSLLLVLVGITVNTSTSSLLLLSSMVLMMIRPRFICFSYAGGALSLMHILFGVPQIDVPQVMGLVAVLHWVEAVLIRIAGFRGAKACMLPVGNGYWQQGHYLNRIWPLPLVALMAYFAVPENLTHAFQEMPQWWPLIPANEQLLSQQSPGLSGAGGELCYSLVPVTAVLGYNDETIGQTPRERAKKTANQLMVYSLLLLFLCWVAGKWASFAVVPALFGPLVHDYLICQGVSSVRHRCAKIAQRGQTWKN